jgi:hypothetical protein
MADPPWMKKWHIRGESWSEPCPIFLLGAQGRSNLGRFWLAGSGCFASLAMTLVTTDMVITKEETFGPVAPLYRFKKSGIGRPGPLV